MSYLKREPDTDDKAALLGPIEDHWRELVALIVPLSRLKHHRRRPSVPEWVHLQTYLNPYHADVVYPRELMLHNHV
jgi:uncharacterized protein YbgA (DUF1722 family)